MISIGVEGDPNRRQQGVILVDEEPWRTIDLTLFGRQYPIPKSALSLDAWKEQFDVLEHQAAKSYALRRLAKKEQTTYELVSLLESKLVSKHTIDQVLAELQTSGYFDNADWVRRFVAFQVSRGHGPDSIKRKLRQKGLPEDGVKDALADHIQAESIQESIEKLLKTRYRQRDLSDYRERQKVVASLVRRGYHFEDIFAVLSLDD